MARAPPPSMAVTQRPSLACCGPASEAARAAETALARSRDRTTALAAWGSILVATGAWAPPAGVSAERRFSVDARAGTGVSVGGGDGQATARRTPTYVEGGVESWLDEQAGVTVSGAVRVEVEDRVSVGGIVRAGLRADLGSIELRPSIGLAALLAPYTLVGTEASVVMAIELAPPLSMVVQLVVDGWVFGTDLAPGTALVMVNGAIGVELAL